MKKNTDGMRYPSIDNLLEKMPSKYELAYASAARAKKLEEGSESVIETKCAKAVGQALEEILEDKVTMEFEER